MADFVQGFINLLSISNFLFINLGLFIGVIFGALPGLTATMGVALFLPVTFGLDPVSGLLLLLGIYCGGTYGGSITAILIKTPGTPASAATVFDGYPMAKNGHAGKALDTALVASTIGGIFSAFILLFAAPQIAKAALKFQSPEKFMLALFGISIVSSVSGHKIFKGLIAASLGMFLSSIGQDPIEGMPRFMFGNNNFLAGINIIPALIGLFAISEIISSTRTVDATTKAEQALAVDKERMSWAEFKGSIKDMLVSSVIGTIIGAIPGTGAAIASFLSYTVAQSSSKTPEKFGTGHINGVAASEAGNNGVTGATLIPMLTLGIPGDAITAVMLGALMMQNLTPGPQLFQTQGAMMYTLMIGLIFVNIFMFIQGKLFIRGAVYITKIPRILLNGVLVLLCIIGGFAANNSIFDVWMMMTFAVIGYILMKYEFPMTPVLIGLILGKMTESNFINSIQLSKVQGHHGYYLFFHKPIALVFFLCTVVSIVLPLYLSFRKKK